jgi:pimeloyl-ACP methyl ester carboxylesterase
VSEHNIEPRSRDVFADARGGRLFARVWDDSRRSYKRPPIVLIHDSLGSVELWRDFPSRLAAATNHPIVAYDRLGFGRSDPHPGVLETIGFIRDEARTSLPALRTALSIDHMILFGHSVGGAMAIAAALEFTAATVGVITESAQVFAEDLTLTSIRAAKSAFAGPGEIERLARYHGGKAAWVLSAWTDTWLAPAFASWTLDDDLRHLRCPLLAMHGDRDEYGSLAHPERIAALAPAPADILILDDCGHVPHREYPDAVLGAIGTFVRKLTDVGREYD